MTHKEVTAQPSTTYSAIPTLASSLNDTPSLVPNIEDPTAPDSQLGCPGYIATNVEEQASGLTADLDLAGPPCNTYGIDIEQLSLLVEYQSQQRLHVQILPRFLGPANSTQYFLPAYISGYPIVEEHVGTNSVMFPLTLC